LITITPLASGSWGNCYHITDGSSPLLLEAGIPFKEIQQKTGFKVSSLAGCLVSHEHQDHCKAVKDLLKAGIEVWMSVGTKEALKISGHRLRPLAPLINYGIGAWTVKPFEVQHDAAEPLGFLLANQTGEKLLYLTDTYYCKYKFVGITHLMIECNHSYEILNENVSRGVLPPAMKKRLIRSHFSLENVKEFLKANDLSKVQEIWLIHMSDGNSNAEQFKREIQELTGKPVYVA
jgi:phosphoribosyl 1,2-cyclic phosphodiesterase